MKTIDSDGSGEIDCEEFIQFFRTVNDLEEMGQDEEDKAKKMQAASCVMCGFLLVTFAGTVYVGFRLLRDTSNTVLKFAFIGFSGMLGLMVCWMLIVPLCYMKLRPVYDSAQERKRERKRLKQERMEAWIEAQKAAIKDEVEVPKVEEERGYRNSVRSQGLRASALADEPPPVAAAAKVAWQEEASEPPVSRTSSKRHSILDTKGRYLNSSYEEAIRRQQQDMERRRAPYMSFSAITSNNHPSQRCEVIGAGTAGTLAITDA